MKTVRRLLIVDDHAELLFGLSTLLTSVGYEVDAAESGAAGFELLRQHNYDAIVLDYRMNEMNGLEFIHKLRMREDWKQIPVVILTASQLHGHECLLAGASRLLHKPCKFDVLSETLAELCDHAAKT